MGINANNVLRLLNQKQETREERILRLAAEKRAQQNKAAAANAVQKTTAVAEDDNRFFKKGAFSDGYQFGDVTKTILGTLHDVSENVTEAVFDATENLIDTTAYGVGAIGGLFDKDFQDKTGQFIAKEILKPKQMGETVATYGQPTGWINLLVNGGKTEENSVLGDKADGLVQSGAHLAGSAALQLVGVPAWLTMGVNAFGSEIESALQQDATYAEAGISGGISAAAEILFERLSSGVKILKGTTADEGLQQLLRTNIKNKLGRTIAKYALDAVGEGTEEVLTEAASAVGRKMTYLKEKEWNEILSREDLFDAFVGGAVMSGVLGGGRILRSAKTGRDYTTGLTANEEKVVNKLYQDELAEREKSGNLTVGEKSKIYDGIVEQMEQGRISTDTIESVLGGDTYKRYQDSLAQERKLQKEIEELESLPDNAITVKQRERLAEARKELEGLDVKGAKSSLFDQVDKMTAKDTKLRESYNERVRRGQKFTADLSQYDEKLRPTIQRAIENGEINNTRTTHAFIEGLAKIEADKGIGFDFTNDQKLAELGLTVAGRNVGGYVDGANVTLNLNSSEALNKVVGHEVAHTFEGSGQYDALMAAMKEFAAESGIDWDAKLQEAKERYKNVKKADPEKELLADMVGEYLFTDSGFVKSLSTKNPGLFKRIYEEIKYLAKTFAGTKQGAALEKVKKTFAEIYRDANVKNTAQTDGVKYSLATNAKTELHKALYDTKYREDVRLRDVTPAIMLGHKGVENLPMAMKASHIRENVFTEEEARKLGLKVDEDTHYHGLGEELFLRVIDGLDNVKEAYRGTKNASDPTRREDYFLLVSEFTDTAGNTINVPVYINRHAQINRVFVDVNKISTVYGKEALQDYIKTQVKNQNLVRIKRRSIESSERAAPMTAGYRNDTSNNSIRNPDKKVNGKFSLSETKDTAPAGEYRITGEDIALAPTREDIARMEQERIATAQNAPRNDVGDIGAPTREDIARMEREQNVAGNDGHISLEDYANNESPVWRNVPYEDEVTKKSIMQDVHNAMVAEGAVVRVSDAVDEAVNQAYPDLRDMKKKERVPILKNAMNKLKNDIRQFLNGFKNQNFEFEVNGKVLDARLYNTGINEVLEKVTQEKAKMLYSTEEIFRNARYLYSTPDYDGDPNVYRWNYFYTPVQIGDETVGVRIAVRDLAKQGESQIYNWGIKKDASLDGVRDDSKNRKPYGVSSDAPTNNIPENGSGVKYSVGEPVAEELETPISDEIVKDEQGIATAPAALRNDVEELGAPTREDIARMEQELQELRETAKSAQLEDTEGLGAPTSEDIARAAEEKELHGPWRMTDPLDQKVEKLFRMMLREEVSEQEYMAQLVKADRQYQQRGSRVEEALERVREAYSKEATATPEIEKKVERLTRKVLQEGIMGRMKDALAEKGFDLNTILKEAKNLSTFATVDNTPQRVNDFFPLFGR